MKASDIFHKTAKGQSEIESRTNALTLKQRRVLILINGENDAATLKEFSLCDNVAEILKILMDLGFIDYGGTTGSPHDFAQQDTQTEAFDVSAQEFMRNTLLTFANRVRVGELLEQIDSIANIEDLKNTVKPWYRAISETPGGMYQVDDLRKEVLEKIESEEINGLQ